jgi:Predicted esterase of the alpha-beta hydrolase superfamily
MQPFQDFEKPLDALVVEGGAMRGIFSAGVLDAFLSHGFNPFDLCVGVSAGATNLASFLAGMYQRSYTVYTDYSLRPEFLSWYKFLAGGHLLDLDWLWDITIKELRIDIPKLINSKQRFLIGVTGVVDGKSHQLVPTTENIEELLKASSSIPVLYRNHVCIDGQAYVDGGLADPIPVETAYRHGARRILVIRSRKKDYAMSANTPSLLYRHYLKDYPQLCRAALERPARYAEAIEFLRNPPPDVQVIEINPPDDFKTGRITKNIQVLKADYHLGVEAGMEAMTKWRELLLC